MESGFLDPEQKITLELNRETKINGETWEEQKDKIILEAFGCK